MKRTAEGALLLYQNAGSYPRGNPNHYEIDAAFLAGYRYGHFNGMVEALGPVVAAELARQRANAPAERDLDAAISAEDEYFGKGPG